jgi:hypothetical protein
MHRCRLRCRLVDDSIHNSKSSVVIAANAALNPHLPDIIIISIHYDKY